jgi:hypothetical protein
MSIEELSFEDASRRQSQIAGQDSKSICTNFCKGSFLRYHKDRGDSNFSTIFLSGTCENSSFILPVSFLLTDPDNLVSHLGSPYAGMCINSDQPEKIKNAYDLCFRKINEKFPNISSLEIRLPPAVIRKSTPIHEWALWSLGCRTKAMYLGRYFSSTNNLKINRNRRRRIGKIDKSNMEIIFSKTPSPEAFEILIENREKRHSVAPTHTLEDLQRIESCIPGTLKSYRVQHSTNICSVAIIFEDSEFATIQYLAGSNCSFKCGSQDLLVQELIDIYLASKKILLFGTSTEPYQNHQTINSGLDNYKGSFGANAYVSSRLTKTWD